MLELEFAELSDTGRIREHNEDCIGHAAPSTAEGARAQGWLFALADGVGGQEHGEVASQLAIENLQSGFRDFRPNETAIACLQRLVQAANLRILETAASMGRGGSNMCTTIVACLIRFDRAVIAHVGDSRCYLIRRGRTEALTRDHTLVGDQVRMGLLTEEQAAESEQRHVLSRSLGSDTVILPEVTEHQLLPGDTLLLSSDGLHGPLTPAEMAVISGQNPDPGEAARRLVSLAREKDGSDNISVQLIRIRSVERMGMYRGRPYKLR
jgi:PPM family protein phosphatase